MPKQGYLYVAAGKKYVNEAIQSVKSLRKVAPNALATLVTTAEIQCADFERIIVLSPTKDNHWKTGLAFKVKGLQLTPYEQTIFLDSDTYFLDNCQELFDLLTYFEVLMSQAPGDTSTVLVNGKPLIGYYPYNSGVMVYKKTPTFEAFLQTWEKIWLEKINHYSGDQGALMEALLQFNFRIHTLPNIYNFRTPFYATIIPKKVKLLHGREKDFEAIGKILNQHANTLRVWHPRTKQVYHATPSFRDRLYSFYLQLPEPLKKVYRFLKR